MRVNDHSRFKVCNLPIKKLQSAKLSQESSQYYDQPHDIDEKSICAVM